MKRAYMGLDIGNYNVKGVIIDSDNNVIVSNIVENRENILIAIRELLINLKKGIDLNNYQIVNMGIVGVNKKIGSILLDNKNMKNDIISISEGITNYYKSISTIIDISDFNSYYINLLEDGSIYNYSICNNCGNVCVKFLENMAIKLGIDIENINYMLDKSKKKIKMDCRCSLFCEFDIDDKFKNGYLKEDILRGIADGIIDNYFNNLVEDKECYSEVILCGDIYKYPYFFKKISNKLNKVIYLYKYNNLSRCIGSAIMSKNCKEKIFDFNILNNNIFIKEESCLHCNNNCQVMGIYKDNLLMYEYGYKCNNGKLIKNL